MTTTREQGAEFDRAWRSLFVAIGGAARLPQLVDWLNRRLTR